MEKKNDRTKRQTITTDNLRQLAKDFGVTLPEKFM
jgi:rhamnulose-1-phosphate aldolase